MSGEDVREKVALLEEELRAYDTELTEQQREILESRAVMEESRARYEDLYEFAPFPYLTLNGTGVVLDANLTTCTFLQVDRKVLLDAPLLAYVAPDERPHFLDHMLRCRKNAGDVRTELRLRRGKEETVPVELLSRPTRVWQSRDLVFRTAVRDLTEQYRAEEARRVLAVEQERAESRRQSRDRFIATISHEMRTPLTPVLACLDALEREDLPERVRAKLAMIRRNVRDEVRLIDDLLDMTRLLRDRLPLLFNPVDLNDVVVQVVRDLRASFEQAEVALEWETKAARARVWGDRQRLRQVFLNLLQNALKATPPGGTVTIRTRNADGCIAAEVTDTGQGMTAEELESIFLPFHQIGANRGGLGLGLSIARGLVESMRGRLWAQSEGPGRGSCFRVELPLSPAGREERGPDVDRAAPAPDTTCRILFVEDHPDSAESLKMLLESEGFEVFLAGSCREARERVQADPDAVDLLISDFRLPDGDGTDVLVSCRETCGSDLPAIAVSGFGTEEDRRRSAEAGFHTHLVKPLSLPKLLDAIREARNTAR